MKKVQTLRKKYPKFVFEKYSWEISKGNLNIFFSFKIEPNIFFKPRVIIKNVKKYRIERVGDRIINNLVFHLGLIELLSYWKATCSPEIEIKAGVLNKEQIKWWKNLIFQGMGQFFYENQIDFLKPDFTKIVAFPNLGKKSTIVRFLPKLREGVLVPVGGGKDSVVTLELLKKAKKEIACFVLNPTKAAKKIMKISRCKESTPNKSFRDYTGQVIVKRKIDKKLLELNRKGFLNGHTPFSAYLAFLSVLCAVLFGFKYIAFSNERSSNEGNVKYLGRTINHQYSKSFDFEQRFRKYSQKYLTSGVQYFSFLRPLYEIQITKLFSRYPKYFNAFVSCNVAFKTNSGKRKPLGKWCNKCPKCLFMFASLYPFLGGYRVVRIFKENLFKRIGLLPTMLKLIGERGFKPFECVGTKKESLVAFYSSLKKYRGQTPVKLPFLLKYFEKKILPKYPNLEKESKKIMNSWNKKHFLPKKFEKILKAAIIYDQHTACGQHGSAKELREAELINF